MQDIDTVVVVAAGKGPSTLPALPARATVIAADGGVDRAYALGLTVAIAIGDFDSVSAEALARAKADGARIVRHPETKDATDLELALDEAVSLGATRAVVVASAGGRLDHLLAAVLLLAADRYAGMEIDALVGDATVHVVRGSRSIAGTRGELVTLLPVGGAVHGIATEGLEYPLDEEMLAPGSSRGVSNIFTTDIARVDAADGVLLAIRPGPAAGESL